MDEFPNTPLVCPATVTIRRNPYRKARQTPSSSIAPRKLPFSPPAEQQEPISAFPTQELKPKKLISSENLKVYLRIRPLTISTKLAGKEYAGGGEGKNVWPKKGKAKNSPKPKAKERKVVCVAAANGYNSVTVTPPESLVESKKVKTEVYEGFSRVFSDEASQKDVYEKMVHPLVDDFLKGKSGMLAALGPSGSGKTHTVFGSVRDPGMVPLALRHIFSTVEGNKKLGAFSLSMFEILSEKGKSERLYDLLNEGSEVQIHQSVIKGLDEVIIKDVLQAESLIAGGMLRRATAATNSNTQSSRSQCIINLCFSIQKGDKELEGEQEKALFTIVDLAGAEREKKTGNQGLRMAESNFINNTSMVFGLCLRSLLEHQKNQRKPLQKHFQNSLLTKYLRDYLEGKKRMALILTVKPGEDDYPETSNLLKQGAPFAQIKFANNEEQKCAKRPIQSFPNTDNGKRMKFSASGKKNVAKGSHGDQADEPQKQTKESCGIVEIEKDVQLKELVAKSEDPLLSNVNDGSIIKVDPIDLARREREHLVMTNFSRALWAVLKEYKGKLEIAQSEIACLRDNLTCETKRSSQLEFELKDLKSTCSGDGDSAEVSVLSTSAACIGTDSSEEQLKKEQENSFVPEIHGELKDLQVVDIYLDTGATVSVASQVDANILEDEAGTDDGLSEIRCTGFMEPATHIFDSDLDRREACSFSEEKESTVPTGEKDFTKLDATNLNHVVCSTSAEMGSIISPPCLPPAEKDLVLSEVIVPGSPAAETEACFFSEEKESSVPTAKKDLAIFDDDALNHDVCSLSIEKDLACSDVSFPESFACSTSAEMESTFSAVNSSDCPSCFPLAEKVLALSEALDSPAAEIAEEKETTVLTAEKDLTDLDDDALNHAVCSLSVEKDTTYSDAISPESFACFASAEMELAISAVIHPDCPYFSLAKKDSALSEVIVQDTVVSDSPATEIESTTPDVILLDSPICNSSPEMKSEIVAVTATEIESTTPDVILLDSPTCNSSPEKKSEIVVPDSPSSSCVILDVSPLSPTASVKMGQVPREQSKKEVAIPKKPGNDTTEHIKQKPRRRLQPIAANLLKNVLDVDEIRHAKGLKGGKALSKGNTSLSRLLSLR